MRTHTRPSYAVRDAGGDIIPNRAACLEFCQKANEFFIRNGLPINDWRDSISNGHSIAQHSKGGIS